MPIRLGKPRAFWLWSWLAAGAALSVVAPDAVTVASAQSIVETHSLYGNYLAGRFARADQDMESAASFYSRALERDPDNLSLLEQAFQMEVMAGNWANAVPLAERLAKVPQTSNRISQFLLGIVAFQNGKYDDAEANFKAAADNPIGELTGAVARGWTRLAAGDAKGALAAVDLKKQPDWARFYLEYHRAMIADIAGEHSIARAAYERMYEQDSRTLRTTLAYAQHAMSRGEFRLALKVLSSQVRPEQGEPHPLVGALLQDIKHGKKSELMITTPKDGLAEVFYGLGEALTGEGGVSLGTIYLQMALKVKPDHVFALAAMAGALENGNRNEDALSFYDRIPAGTPLQNAIDIRRAINLNALDKVSDAEKLLEGVTARDPRDLRPLETLGNIMRARKNYDGAITVFTRAIDIIGKPDGRHWTFFYARGTAYERTKNWPAAERDLKTALKLSPDEPLILNYLGYSWIDQGINIKEGTRLIEKAVQLKPDDGYIVDSLGWALFKQGKYKQAVRYLERAVELKPQDPTLNDHLGDAYWRVGREREARFQWSQALTLSPEPEDVVKIKTKLESGLPEKAKLKTVQKKNQAAQRAKKDRPTKESRSTPPPQFPGVPFVR